MKKFLLSAFCISVFVISGYSAFSQCKTAAKKQIPQLSPYTFSGQINTVNLIEGEGARLTGALLGGQEYRILVAGNENMGPLSFKILDKNKNVVFDNKDHNNAQVWDFKVNSTEEYTIEVAFKSKGGAGDTRTGGCAGILVGFKASK